MKAPILLCAATLSALAFPAFAADDRAAPRLIAVSGDGEVLVTPDRARLVMVAGAVEADLKVAEEQVNRMVRDYLVAAAKLGAQREQLRSTSVTVQPEYVWDDQARQQKLVGYRVQREIEVAISDLSRLGDYILSATEAGITQVQAPVLESSREDALEREALSKAVTDARSKAEVLAKTLGVSVGTPRTIRVTTGASQPPILYKAAAMRAEASFDSGNQQMGMAAGQIRIAASADVEFDLTP